MKYIQNENVFILILGVLIFALLICWIRNFNIKESKKLQEQNQEMDSITKMRSWSIYIIAGLGIIAMLFEVLKRLYLFMFH